MTNSMTKPATTAGTAAGTMRAIACHAIDAGLGGLRLDTVPMPSPAAGEVRVRLRAASLNPVDWKLAAGVAPWLACPQVIGVDGAGTIDALGEGVTGWRVGERVAWHGNLRCDGTFADYALAPAHVLARIPDAVDDAAAAALPCAGMTAYQALVRKARLAAGQTLVVQGASGAVGGYAVQIAKSLGARVIALTREAHVARVRALGADHVLMRDAPTLREQVRELTGGDGADAMLEVMNPGDARRSLDLLRYNGQLMCIDPMPNLAAVPPYTYAASIHEVALGGAYAAGHLPTQHDFSTMLGALFDLVAAGQLDPMIHETIALDAVSAGLRALRENGGAGKTVVDFAMRADS